jgi:hypothetical protein
MKINSCLDSGTAVLATRLRTGPATLLTDDSLQEGLAARTIEARLARAGARA